MDSPSERLSELPPSAKLVFKALEYSGRLTQQQIAEETLLPPRTVRFALSKLEDADLVDGTVSFMDARKRVFELTATGNQAIPSVG